MTTARDTKTALEGLRTTGRNRPTLRDASATPEWLASGVGLPDWCIAAEPLGIRRADGALLEPHCGFDLALIATRLPYGGAA